MTRLGHRSLLTLLLGLFLLGCLQATILRAEGEGPAAAAEAKAGESHEGHSAVFKWINFAILVAGLGYVLRKPLAQFFSDRSATIEKRLSEGRKALEAAEAQLRAVELKLQNFEAEMAAFANIPRAAQEASKGPRAPAGGQVHGALSAGICIASGHVGR